MKKGNIVFALILLSAMILLLILSFDIPEPLSEFELGAGYVPSVYLYVAIGLLSIIIAGTVMKNDQTKIDFNRKTLFYFFLAIVYVIAIDLAGFYIPTLAVLVAFFIILGERRKHIIISVPAGFLLFIYVVFQKILHIRF